MTRRVGQMRVSRAAHGKCCRELDQRTVVHNRRPLVFESVFVHATMLGTVRPVDGGE
jgi:hypothetical protein